MLGELLLRNATNIHISYNKKPPATLNHYLPPPFFTFVNRIMHISSPPFVLACTCPAPAP